MEGNEKESFLGRFQLLAKMSQGGMATLYLGRLSGPERFQKLLVIKKIHEHLANERQFVDMLMDEARIAALIQHPNVGSIFELGVAVTHQQLARVVSGLFQEQKKEKDVQLKTALSDGPRKKAAEEWTGDPSSDPAALADTLAGAQVTAPTIAGRRGPEPTPKAPAQAPAEAPGEVPAGEPREDPAPIELRRKTTKSATCSGDRTCASTPSRPSPAIMQGSSPTAGR